MQSLDSKMCFCGCTTGVVVYKIWGKTWKDRVQESEVVLPSIRECIAVCIGVYSI